MLLLISGLFCMRWNSDNFDKVFSEEGQINRESWLQIAVLILILWP